MCTRFGYRLAPTHKFQTLLVLTFLSICLLTHSFFRSLKTSVANGSNFKLWLGLRFSDASNGAFSSWNYTTWNNSITIPLSSSPITNTQKDIYYKYSPSLWPTSCSKERKNQDHFLSHKIAPSWFSSLSKYLHYT